MRAREGVESLKRSLFKLASVGFWGSNGPSEESSD